MSKTISASAALLSSVLGIALASVSAPASAGFKDAFKGKGSAQDERKQGVAQIPTCSKPLGSLSVIEPEDAVDWWTGQQLPAPSKLIKVFVSKSRCFTLVDRGAGMAASQRERDMAANGDLRARSNMGKGQIRAADYVMTPDLISQNHNAGGSAIAGVLGGLVGGNAGNLVGGLNLSKKTADVVLTITDVRSSEQVAMAEGNAKKTDLGWGARGNLFSGGDYGAAGAGGYANTGIGQVITLAYLQAYTDIVSQLGGLSGNAAASNTQQAVTVTRAGRLLGNAKGTGAAVRTLEPGMMLYPTGTKEGVMWEVEDEMGNRGWVSSAMLERST
ncbi:peptidoglycan-binding protein [Xanthomonas oryzae]|uniref:Peptidoglycan-binding protein n=1 Tax=Xanthomonas oryzae TaxID=347 RepID=A0AAP0ZR08_9XANT|nr:CsgG/HfaB family protein [Xanthomonas oryzae]KOR50278.1 peptidoglycan-binding protein [Xanthomonas oryzae]QBG85945.1 peptidoglycan-binding protein [Xanthomonas oryzae]